MAGEIRLELSPVFGPLERPVQADKWRQSWPWVGKRNGQSGVVSRHGFHVAQ
jgi:hypothetical protein